MTKSPRDRTLLGTLLIYTGLVAVILVLPIGTPHIRRGYLAEYRLPLGRRLLADVAVNAALFAPIGWGVHRVARSYTRRQAVRILLAVGAAALFSFAMEAVQLWLPGRYSSIVDVAVNTLGAALGAWAEARLGRGRG
ncbi:MAG TPA: VanZ family protein [Methylomirabilota bacterium]|nr:VanZ family protein [Methylomirabilota bacterium]